MTPQVKETINAFVKEAASFLTKAMPELEKTASLETEVAGLRQENANLKQASQSQTEGLRQKTASLANKLVERGFLDKRNRDEFLNKIASDPSELLAVIDWYDENVNTVKSIGTPSVEMDKTASAVQADPFLAYLFGDSEGKILG